MYSVLEVIKMVILVDRLVQAINDRSGFCEWLENIDYDGLSIGEAFEEALIITGLGLDDIQYCFHIDEEKIDFGLTFSEGACPGNQ
jgi:hypothetical protein